ncbi:MAG: right-handed parallel beta-helix repeat-containing protein [Clostridia bacterium]|nr:right-handed parallel beta-helix repeat-containing protein [Clostridia bacterium]
MERVFDVTVYGAAGDGATDCTGAFQAAICDAAKVKGAVTVPPGTYVCGRLKLYPSVCLSGYRGWGYRERGGSVIKLRDGEDVCLIDMSGAFGSCLKDIQLLGNDCAGEGVHGVYVRWEDQESRLADPPEREGNSIPEETHKGFREDSVTVDGCSIKNFSGDAIHFERIWAFTVKDCLLASNGGSGVYIRGWDGWITNCIMYGNRGAGIYSDIICAAVTVIGNRIEWNRNGGINLTNGRQIQMTGNYFDRSYGPAVTLRGKDFPCDNIAATANYFNRSGRYRESFADDPYENSHLYFDNCRGLAFTGNTCSVGRDDFGTGNLSPEYGIVFRGLESCVISGNSLYRGASRRLILDLGDNADGNVIKDNPGTVFSEKDE